MYLFKSGKASRLLKIILGFFITLYLAVWLFSPQIISYYLNEPLAQLNLKQSANSHVRFNPFLSKLKLTDFALEQDSHQVITVDELIIDVDLFALINDEIQIDIISIANANIEIIQTAEQLTVAGVSIGETKAGAESVAKDEATDATQNEAKLETKEAPFKYRIKLAELVISNSNIIAHYYGSKQQLSISELTVNNSEFSLDEQLLELAFSGEVNGAPLNLSVEAELQNKHGEISSTIGLSAFPLASLAVFMPEETTLDGLVDISGQQALTLNEETIRVALSSLEIKAEQINAHAQQHSVLLDSINFDMPTMELEFVQNAVSELSGQGELSLNNLKVNSSEQQQLIAFEKLLLSEIVPSWQQDEATPNKQGDFHVAVSALDITQLLLSKVNEQTPALTTIDTIALNSLSISPKHFSVDTIEIGNITGDIVIDENKVLKHLVRIAPEKESSDNTAEHQSVQQENAQNEAVENDPFTFHIEKIDISKTNQINFTDESVDPVYKRSLYIDEFTLGALGNTNEQREKKAPFKFVGRSNTYANFSFEGFTQPFATQPSHHVTGQMNEVSLVAVSSYMKEALQMELKSGQLNMNIDATLIGDEISGEVALNMNGLETTVADDHEANSAKDNAAVPLNVALGMLMDSNGDVELDVPLSGSTADPQFGLTSFFALVTQKAVMSAAESYLVKTFVPYANVVSVAMVAGEMLLKIRFEDLAYQPKQIEPDEQQEVYLKAFIQLMQDNEDAKVKVCGVTTPADIDLPVGTAINEKSDIKALHAIGKERVEAFKAHVTKNQVIASSRIILCAPQIDTDGDATSRIEISL